MFLHRTPQSHLAGPRSLVVGLPSRAAEPVREDTA
jgi:hypothetical protein